MEKLSLENQSVNYDGLISQISERFLKGQARAAIAVNSEILDAYWEIGKYIVEFEQKGKDRAEFGEQLLKKLSQDLKLRHGKGFSHSNVYRMRQLYMT